MPHDELLSGEMKYSFRVNVEACGFRGDLIISSSSVNDLVKSLRLLERADIQQGPQVQPGVPMCPIHQLPLKPSRKPGTFYCSARNDDGSYCSHKAKV